VRNITVRDSRESSTRESSTPESSSKWLTSNLLVLCAVSFFQDAASEMLYPVLPIFVTTTLGAPVVAVGVIDGIVEGVAALSKWRAGVNADRRHNRRRFVAIGYGLAAVGKSIVAAAWVWPIVLLGRGVDRLGKGIRDAPRDALLVHGIPEMHRGKAFGIHRTFDSAGAVAGPLVGLFLYRAMNQRVRPVLWVAIVPAIVSVLLVAAVRENRSDLPSLDAVTRDSPSNQRSGARGLAPPVRKIISVLTCFSVVNIPVSLLLLRAKSLGLSVTSVIAAYVLVNVVYTVVSFPAGVLADRLHPAILLGAGLLAFACCCTGLALITDAVWVWPLFASFGLFVAATDGVAKAWISSLVSQEAQARTLGVFAGCWSGGTLIAGVTAGMLWGRTGRVPLLCAGAGAFVVALVLLVGRASFDESRHGEPGKL
jgi:MFS family permease